MGRWSDEREWRGVPDAGGNDEGGKKFKKEEFEKVLTKMKSSKA